MGQLYPKTGESLEKKSNYLNMKTQNKNMPDNGADI